MKQDFMQAMIKRRSIYQLGDNVALSKEQIATVISECVKHTPSAFNMPTTNIVVAFGEKHQQIWQNVKAVLKEHLAKKEDVFSAAQAKIDKFASGIGTILYYEDQEVVNELKETYAMYVENFSVWSMQAGGMVQFAVWSALADNGIGANLQHYNPLIDEKMKEMFNVPDTWKLVAQMPFGSIEQQPGEKYFEPLDNRIKVY